MALEEGDVVMCTVERIEGTIVFVKIDGNGQGSIVLSEIAPGRIRNLRAYVVPKKRIICKVLRIRGDRVDLSLRRVSPKEQKKVLDQYSLEKSYRSILKSILKGKTEKVLEDILKEETIYEFIEEAKEDPKKLEKLVGKVDAKKVLEIINTQKQKTFKIRKELKLTTDKPDGISLIKKILSNLGDVKAKYISAGRYNLEAEGDSMKEADQRIKERISQIEEQAKKSDAVVVIK